MSAPGAVIVFDVGRTNVRLTLLDPGDLSVVSVLQEANRWRDDGPYPHADVAFLWAFLCDGLRRMARERPPGRLVVTTHGAAAAVCAPQAPDGLALPVLDYEHPGPQDLADYDRLRGPFEETLSPSLPGGLNLARQLLWQRARWPDAFAAASMILPYPQYWGWRLTGRAASEATSLGCHTDLWNPQQGRFSRLARDSGLADLFPPRKDARQLLGTMSPELARRLELPAGLEVMVGVHDSNASLYPHLLARGEAGFGVVSSGTWTIVMAPGGGLDWLDATRDCLANVDVFGRPVPGARFMGGREYGHLLGPADASASAGDVATILERGVMALPAFVPGVGPFGGCKGRWSHDPEDLSPGERAAAAAAYCALVTEVCLDLSGAVGDVLVEGPFAANAAYGRLLADLVGRPVLAEPEALGTTLGAALLAAPEARIRLSPRRFDPDAAPDARLAAYRNTWKKSVAGSS